MQMSKRRVGVDPEDRRADQQIAQRAAADAGHHREEDEGDERLAVFSAASSAPEIANTAMPK